LRVGDRTSSITGLTGRRATDPMPTEVTAGATIDAGDTIEPTPTARIDTPKEADYECHGGILQYVGRHLPQP